ncbi:hypothetical protein GCM10023354_00980 [Garicola koreensis]|uniref:hypothetical protein n=1 Tax=Garicola koreensis TaxID=1262554 RepID=UPI0031EE5948
MLVAGVLFRGMLGRLSILVDGIIFSGIALGSVSALAIYHGMGAVARWRGTDAPGQDADQEAVAAATGDDRTQHDDDARPDEEQTR